MAVRCNIATNALQKVKSDRWGIARDIELNKSLVANYVEYQGCTGLILKSCENFDCAEQVVNVTCNLNVVAITAVPSTSPTTYDIEFKLGDKDIYGAKTPITYQWKFDTSVFTVVGSTTATSVKLKLVAGKVLSSVSTGITVDVVDANGCKDTKTCYYVGKVMECSNNYVYIPPPTALEVTPVVTTCSRPASLSVKQNVIILNIAQR